MTRVLVSFRKHYKHTTRPQTNTYRRSLATLPCSIAATRTGSAGRAQGGVQAARTLGVPRGADLLAKAHQQQVELAPQRAGHPRFKGSLWAVSQVGLAKGRGDESAKTTPKQAIYKY